MAELPRYQQTGRVFADVPQLDFASVRESMKLSNSMGNALDRLSEFAGKFAAKQVERQAEQYAIENPITIEQLQQAKQSGIDPDELIKATGGGAIWEDTLRKLQGEQLRAQLEVQGKGALTEIQALFDANQINDIAEVKSKFNSIIQGTAAPLARISPESAIKLQQSLGVTANAYYREATNKLADDYVRDQQMLSAKNLDYSVNAAKSMINTINDPAMLTEAKDLLKIRLYEQSREGGTLFAQKQVEEFDKQFEELKINNLVENALSDNFYVNPLTKKRDSLYAYNKLVTGQLPGKEAIWESLSYKEKAIVFNNFRQRENEIAATQKQAETLQHEQDLVAVNSLLIDYYNGGTRDKSLFKQLEEISARNPRAFSAKELNDLRESKAEDVEKNMSKWAYSDDVTRLKLIVTSDRSASWDTIKGIGLSYGIPSQVINRYVFPFYINPNERDYNKNLDVAVPSYGSDAGAKIYKEQEKSRIDSIVKERLRAANEENDKVAPEKRKPVPSQTEMLKIVQEEEDKSKKVVRLETSIQEGNAVISARKISGIQLNKFSSINDPVLMSRVNKLDPETKDLIISYIKKIEQNK